MMRGGQHKMAAISQDTMGECGQLAGRIQMLDNLGGNHRIEPLRIIGQHLSGTIIDCQFVKCGLRTLLPCNPHALCIRLHPNHVVTFQEERVAQGAIAGTQIKHTTRFQAAQRIEYGRLDIRT